MLRPFLVLLLGLATVSSSTKSTTTTLWTKLNQTQELTCPMPDDGEKIQVCAWRFGDEGAFKSSFKKLHGDRISIEENNTECMIRIERVEEEDQGTWGCKIQYQNKDGDIIETEAERIIYVAKPDRKPDQTHELTCPMPDDGEKSSMKVSSVDKLSTKNTTEAANNCISENCNSVTVERNDWADWVSGILFFLVAGFLETYDKITKNVPFEFAYSVALSPSAAAGVAKSGELGIAFGSNGDMLVFGSRCFGVKTDVSLEFDLVVGAWTSISYILGQNYAIGLGVDNVNFELGSEESGGNFEVLFNSERVIGGTVSLGRGVGYDLPINSEVNFEKCHTVELMRLDWRNFYSNLKK